MKKIWLIASILCLTTFFSSCDLFGNKEDDKIYIRYYDCLATSEIPPKEVEPGTILTEEFLPVQQKDGLIFLGWSITDDKTKTVLTPGEYTATETCTLFAKWVSKMTVTYETDYGTAPAAKTFYSAVNDVDKVEVFWENKLPSFDNGTIKKYSNGWKCVENNTYYVGESYAFWDGGIKDITLKAVWVDAIKITLHYDTRTEFWNEDENGVEAIVPTDTQLHYSSFYSYFYSEEYAWLDYYQPKTDNFIIYGWTKKDPSKAQNGDAGSTDNPYVYSSSSHEGKINDGEDFYAVWKQAVNLIFETNGGSRVDSETVIDDCFFYQFSDLGIAHRKPNENSGTNGGGRSITPPTKNGYNFGGWYTDNEFNNKIILPKDNENEPYFLYQYDALDKTTTPWTLTLYAKWEAH